ncbi:MAG: HD domain-containing protein [Firmicutes bacterium]|nr:HD domain-containing protein [Bacillota bacterium]
MKYINELKEGDSIIAHYLCKEKKQLRSKAGRPYLSLTLADKTGTASAKVWDVTNEIKPFEENDFIKIDAHCITYQNDIQLNIRRLRKSEPEEYDPMDYIPCTEKNIPEMLSSIKGYIDTVENGYVKTLLKKIFEEDEKISGEFVRHSAAKLIHHNYLGGLLEHTLNVVEICDFMAPRFKNVNRDVLIACAMLHDVGKIAELSEFPINDYTEDGQLLGHIYMGAELVAKKAKDIPDFPPMLETLIKHCILAHHGEYEWGSPKLPRTIEAFILHVADRMDAMTKVFDDTIENSPTKGPWTDYQKLFQRTLRKSDF